MKRTLKIIGLVALGLLTVANSGLFYYTLTRTNAASRSSKIVNLAPKPTQKVASAKLHTVDASQEGSFQDTGKYSYLSLDTSRLDQKTGGGSLVLASYADQGANFVLATAKDTKIDDSVVATGWQTKLLANDPLWAPGACSAKPTLLLQGRYIFIDDGKTKPEDKYNSYLVFDMQTGKYNYFGGDSFSDAQATKENIMLATNENDQLVFYIDQLDPDGPLASSTSFKHVSTHARNYIIRRVIDPATMQYKDYKLPFSRTSNPPAGVPDYFYLAVLGNSTTDQPNTAPTLRYTTDPEGTTLEGQVVNNMIDLKTPASTVTVATTAQTTGPYDTTIEKQLNDPLTKSLPGFIGSTKIDPSSYTTNFTIYSLGVHAQNNFVIASSRTGTYASTPVTVDAQGAVHPMTEKPVLPERSYVPLGVF